MSRIRFLQTKQGNFLNRIKRGYKLKWTDMARICGIHHRTLFDWRRDKYQVSYEAFQILKNRYSVATPKIEVLPENWNNRNAARLGAIRRMELHGNLGTTEGRRKGGLTTWRRYGFNPKRFIETGFIGPKEINYPPKSPLLSELIGIILGDGSITKYQIVISLNDKTDRDYAHFIVRLFKKLFDIKVALK